MRVSVKKVAFTLAAIGVCAFGYSFATEYAQTQSARASACRALLDQALQGGQELTMMKAANGDFFRAAIIPTQPNKHTLSVASSSDKDLSGVLCPVLIIDKQALMDNESSMTAFRKTQDGPLVIEDVTTSGPLSQTTLEQGLSGDRVSQEEVTGYRAYDRIMQITAHCESVIKKYNNNSYQTPHP